MRVAAEVMGFVGASTFAAGLYGLWGWPAAALFVGAFFLALATGLTLIPRKG